LIRKEEEVGEEVGGHGFLKKIFVNGLFITLQQTQSDHTWDSNLNNK